MENLLKTELIAVINKKKGGHLPDWTFPVNVETEDTAEKVFDIVDTKGTLGTIVRASATGQATYYNGDNDRTYSLRFIKYEEFINQFKRPADANSATVGDWCKGVHRPDYLCYTINDDTYFIIHELSEGNVRNKLSDARIQLVSCVLFLMNSDAITQYIGQFTKRVCYVSAKGGIEYSPNGMADSFNEIYNNIPDPNPIKCSTFAKRGFEAYETKVIKL